LSLERLSAKWEDRLEQLEQVEHQRDEARRQHVVELSPADRTRIRGLARDLPKVWRADTTLISERKAMLRLVVEAISVRSNRYSKAYVQSPHRLEERRRH